MFRIEAKDKLQTTHVVIKRVRALHLPQFSPHNDMMVWIVKRRVLQVVWERCYSLEDDNHTVKKFEWDRIRPKTSEPMIDITAFATKEAALVYASWFPQAVRIEEK